MPELKDISIKVKNYKSFGDKPEGFDRLAQINLIIGKNNSGKSALLDAIEYSAVQQESILPSLHHNGEQPELIIKNHLEDFEISSVFPKGTGGGVVGGDFYEYGKAWVGKPITLSYPVTKGTGTFVDIEPSFTTEAITREFSQRLAERVKRPFEGYAVRRIAADRDIATEAVSEGANLSPNGEGATNLIRYCLHDADANATSFIKSDLLDALNYVFEGETTFTDILVKSRGGMWEVYLVEDTKGNEVSLSNSGSGLKTIILVLLQLLVMPKFLPAYSQDHFIFSFEEIENNLHPGLLRNMLTFIRSYAEEKGSVFFITTHSSVSIDLFDGDIIAQIVHVTHDKKISKVTTVSQHLDKKGVIDDLDIRASDILQSNSVIWVEGPSDRIYINHWISLYSDGKLKEGKHYQCVFYGGRLLARLSADPANSDEVNILSVNSNAILVIDSDITTPNGNINATKQRMKQEVDEVNGYVWVTDGKEIENYLPKTLLESYYNQKTKTLFKKTTKIQNFLNNLKSTEGDKFVANKVLYADAYCELFTKDMLDENADLKNHVAQVCKKLRTWNKLEKPPID